VKRLIIIIAIVIAGKGVKAQSELTLPLFQNVFQSSYVMPTVKLEHTVSIGLPGLSSIYAQAIHNGFVPNSFINRDGDTLRIDPASLVDNLRERNMLFANADVDLFHLRIRVYNWNYWIATRQRHSVSFFYPKDMMRLFTQGNASMVGETIDFSNLGINANLHREYSFGLSTEIDKWAFGGRISLLQGLSNVYLNPKNLGIFIDSDMYAHTVEADATLNTAGVPFEFDALNLQWGIDYLTKFRNPGVSISLGTSYMYDLRTTFSFGISDLGFISWNKNDTKNFKVDGAGFFDGFDVLGGFLTGTGMDIESTIDNFVDGFRINDEGFEESYMTWLPTKFYLTTNYQLARKTNFGFQLYGVANRGFYPAFSMGFSQGLGRYLSLALTAGYNQRTATNLGFGLMLKPGPFQIYMLADNYYTPVVDPLTFTNVNFRFGINLVFGRVKTQQGLPYM
jgi:hypothetical protein